jgi:transcriptional regulator with XRE-family HTH domain
MDNKITSERLQLAMDLCHVKQVDLARITGLSKQRINNYIKGHSVPKSQAVFKMAHYLLVSPSWLMGVTDDDEPNVNLERDKKIAKTNEEIQRDSFISEIDDRLYKLSNEQLKAISKTILMISPDQVKGDKK